MICQVFITPLPSCDCVWNAYFVACMICSFCFVFFFVFIWICKNKIFISFSQSVRKIEFAPKCASYQVTPHLRMFKKRCLWQRCGRDTNALDTYLYVTCLVSILANNKTKSVANCVYHAYNIIFPLLFCRFNGKSDSRNWKWRQRRLVQPISLLQKCVTHSTQMQ